MAQRPIIRVRRERKAGSRIKSGRRPRFPKRISSSQQAERHSSAFDDIARSVDRLSLGVEASENPAAATPDRALVFETIGPVAKFAQAARELGFEWLGEDLPEYDEVSALEIQEEGETPKMGVLYLTMPSLDGLKRLLALWNRYSNNESAPEGRKEWWALFGYLSDLRVWSAKDRVDPSISTYVAEALRRSPEDQIRIEIDLWFHDDPAERAKALEMISAVIRLLDGVVHEQAEIPDIKYHAILAQIPAGAALELTNLSGPLAIADAVMSVRPQSIFYSDRVEERPDADVAESRGVPTAINSSPALAAILDGYPVQDHELLRNRVDMRHISRMFVENINDHRDASLRATMTETYLALANMPVPQVSDTERAIILQALFRPSSAQTSDEGVPHPLVDLIANIKSKGIG